MYIYIYIYRERERETVYLYMYNPTTSCPARTSSSGATEAWQTRRTGSEIGRAGRCESEGHVYLSICIYLPYIHTGLVDSFIEGPAKASKHRRCLRIPHQWIAGYGLAAPPQQVRFDPVPICASSSYGQSSEFQSGSMGPGPGALGFSRAV